MLVFTQFIQKSKQLNELHVCIHTKVQIVSSPCKLGEGMALLISGESVHVATRENPHKQNQSLVNKHSLKSTKVMSNDDGARVSDDQN